MGSAAKKAGGAYTSAMTGGAFSTNGGGWAQGGSLKNSLNNTTGGMIPALNGSQKVDVPEATQQAQWNLSGADGKLRSDLMLGSEMPKAFGQSQDVLDNLVGRATATGPSQSAQYLQQANQRGLDNNLASADATNAQGVANTTGMLAMRGGLDSGSRERIGRSSNTDTMLNKSKMRNDASGADLNILAQDEAQKNASLQALPASLLAQAGMGQSNKQFDISNTLSTVGGKYNADMAAWGANQAAREQAQLANKPQGLLGLGIMGL